MGEARRYFYSLASPSFCVFLEPYGLLQVGFSGRGKIFIAVLRIAIIFCLSFSFQVSGLMAGKRRDKAFLSVLMISI
jgi:hypothetical protein